MDRVALSQERRAYLRESCELVATRVVPPEERAARVAELDGNARRMAWAIRHLLLAYAFAREREYRRVEPKTAEGNSPRAEQIARLVEDLAPSPDENGRIVRIDAIRAWLAPPRAAEAA